MISLFLSRIAEQFGHAPFCNGIPSHAPILFGFCLPLCWRCTGFLLGGIITMVTLTRIASERHPRHVTPARPQRRERVSPLHRIYTKLTARKWWHTVLFGLACGLPATLDGTAQALSQGWLPIEWHSHNLLRVSTGIGGGFGFALAVYAFVNQVLGVPKND